MHGPFSKILGAGSPPRIDAPDCTWQTIEPETVSSVYRCHAHFAPRYVLYKHIILIITFIVGLRHVFLLTVITMLEHFFCWFSRTV